MANSVLPNDSTLRSLGAGAKAGPEFDQAFGKYIPGVQALSDQWYQRSPNQAPVMEFEVGPKYIRVVRRDPVNYGGGGSVHSFVDRTNGNILKGSWKSPVKNGVRGNIFSDDNGLSRVNWHGPIYLRGGM